MPESEWEKARHVFEDALKLTAQERSSFLEAHCTGDEGLRAEVESLLDHHDNVDGEFLIPPPLDDCAADSPVGSSMVGNMAGQCLMEEIIARGGMGTVYLAEQQSLRRKVAVKVLDPGTYSPSALRRFEHEAQILASLKHPNIAHVFDAGTVATPSGQVPYFAMELVENAKTIIDYGKSNSLSTGRRIDLFLQACDAVQYAHAKGVIHRDLKPSNILVDATGRARVIDFGIARTTDMDVALTTLQTGTGQLLGTLQYMSPEQCDANPHELDVRTDVYSLGVVLYQLLTDQLPYDVSTATVFRATQIIKTQEPLAMVGARELRGDLEVITLTALSKDREKRYQSVVELAADIRRYMRHEPIAARAPSLWSRSVNWQRRHPIASTVIASSILATAILASSVITRNYLDWRYYRQPDRIEARDNFSSADLRPRRGKPLRSWRTDQREGIRSNDLLELPRASGGGRDALIGFASNAGGPCAKYAGSLCAFDVNQTTGDPRWRRAINKATIQDGPTAYRASSPGEFGMSFAELADVFPDAAHPGEEIIAVFSHARRDARIIRVYDHAGSLLYQAWHKGGITSCGWLPQAGLMVFFAEDGHGEWSQRGLASLNRLKPWVVFAVRPKPGLIMHDWLDNNQPDHPMAWYQCIMPPEEIEKATEIVLEFPKPETAETVRIVVWFVDNNGRRGGFSWDVNTNGVHLDGSLVISDEYDRWKDNPELSLPDPKDFRLEDLPPIVPPE